MRTSTKTVEKTTRQDAEMASVENMASEIEKRHGVHWAERKAGPSVVRSSHIIKASTPLGEIFPALFLELGADLTKLNRAKHTKRAPTTARGGQNTKKKNKSRQPVVEARGRMMNNETIAKAKKSIEAITGGDAHRVAKRISYDIRGDASFAVAFI